MRKGTLLFIIFLFVSINSYSANYYVNDGMNGTERWCTQPGNDSNNGQATNTPKETITNLLNTQTIGPNDVVYIDAGTYNEAISITSDDDGNNTGYVTLRGINAVGTNTIIKGNGASGWQGCIEMTGLKYVIIDSLYIKYYDHTSQDVRGVLLNNCTNIKIINCVIISNRREGIRAGDSGDGIYYSVISNNICCYNNQISDTWPAGIQLAKSSRYNRITDNMCKNNARGIFLEQAGTKSNVIQYNTIYSNRSGSMVGLYIESPYNTILSNWIYYNNIGMYSDVDACHNYIAKNILFFNTSDGLSINRGFNTITNNNIYYNQGRGIKMEYNASNNLIINNRIYGNTNEGIVIESGGSKAYYNNIIDNLIYYNSHGIFVNWSGNNFYIAGNEIAYNDNEGICLNRYNNTVTNNIIHNNGAKGILLNFQGSNNKILNNQIYNCSHGIEFGNENDGNPMVKNFIFKNNIYNCTWDGIAGHGGDYNIFISNDIHHNGTTGISFHGNTNNYNIIKGNNFFRNSTVGLKVIGHYNTLISNSASTNSEEGIQVTGRGNVLKYNSCSYNGRWGIWMDGQNSFPCTNAFNICYRNTWEGFMINNSGVNSIIKNCVSFQNGSDGIDLNSGTLLVKNCISASNTLTGYNQTAGTITVNYSDAFGNGSGAYDSATTNNCLISDPRFESTNPSDSSFLHLSGWSSCINAGDPSDPGLGQGTIDMGAHEYQLPSSAPDIIGISTNQIGRGNELIINGTDFQNNQYRSTVAFSNTTDGLIYAPEYILWSDTTIRVTVPFNLTDNLTNSIIVTTWGGKAVTNKAVKIINAYADIVSIGVKAPSVSPDKGKTTTSFTFNVYYRDIENDPPDQDYPKIVTTRNGIPVFTNSMSTNISTGDWTNGRLCECSFTIPFEHSNISNYFLVKASSGNTNEHKTASFKLISRVDESVLPAINLARTKVSSTSLTVKWTIQEPFISSQVIYWSLTPASVSSGSSIALLKNVTSYKIESLTPGKDYYIVIRSLDDIGNYSDSSEAVFQTLGQTPTEKLEIWNNKITEDAPKAQIWINNPENPLANITIKIYTLYGKLVKKLVDAPLNTVEQPIEWDGTDAHGSSMPSGVYIIYGKGYKYNEKKRVYIIK